MADNFFANVAIDGEERYTRMRENAARKVGRLEIQPPREGIVAVCGFGPSLTETWDSLKNYQYIITTSGAHNFLIDHGIVPTWHVEYDPRTHKCFFLQRPHPDVIYYISSQCHPQMFDMLPQAQIRMWHGIGADVDRDRENLAQVEPGAILITGGSNAGIRAIVIGYCLGFRQLAFFGMDCSYKMGMIWAGPHSGIPHRQLLVECNGRQFWTSPTMINSADELWITMRRLNDATFKIVGDNLFAERIKLAAKDPDTASRPMAWWKPIGWEIEEVDDVTGLPIVPYDPTGNELISDYHREQNAQLHQSRPDYGSFGKRHAERVRQLMAQYGSDDVLDYGCGKRTLAAELGNGVKNYDPAISGHDALPDPTDIVVCTDVLEHVEPDRIDAVLAHLASVVKRCALIEVSLQAAIKKLPDGRNAHTIVKSHAWWHEKLKSHFTLEDLSKENSERLIAIALPTKEK